MQSAVSGFEKEFPGRVQARNLDATTPEAKELVRSLGFSSHGLVVRSPKGPVLWKQPDHQVNIEDVRNRLKELLTDRH